MTRYFQLRDFHKALNSDVVKKSRGNPPWLKDYCGQFEDPEYLFLTLSERGLLKDLRLLAARRGNRILDDEKYLRAQLRITYRTQLATKLRTLRTYGFIEDYDMHTNEAAKALFSSRDVLEERASEERSEEKRVEVTPLPPFQKTGRPSKVRKAAERREAFVRNTALEYTDFSLREELLRMGADDLEVQRLLNVAGEVRAA